MTGRPRNDLLRQLTPEDFELLAPHLQPVEVEASHIVHVNRTIQKLRHRGLIAWDGSEIELLQPEELRRLADFRPDYLS
ncbi:helix-turn-helix domain-containing protein [Bradyrhizobium liaoningense]